MNNTIRAFEGGGGERLVSAIQHRRLDRRRGAARRAGSGNCHIAWDVVPSPFHPSSSHFSCLLLKPII